MLKQRYFFILPKTNDMKKVTMSPQEQALYPSECTTIIVGKKMTQDGSMIVARSDDWNAVNAKKFKSAPSSKTRPRRIRLLQQWIPL